MKSIHNQLQLLKDVLSLEAEALLNAREKITEEQVISITQLFDHLITKKSSLIFCGVGKSAIIAQKLASTFISLGRPSHFLHPVEALHGDLGMIDEEDLIFFLSKSGYTEEIIKILPFIKIKKKQRIGLLGNINSPIAEHCHLVFNCHIKKEACINDLAPTTSSTLTLAIGDALAVLYEHIAQLSREHFAFNHPGGLLGKTLRIQVKHLMCPRKHCPIVQATATLKDALLEMTRLPVGGCAVLDKKNYFLGIIVEADIRRTFAQTSENLSVQIDKVMNSSPVKIAPTILANEALLLMETRKEGKINLLPVIEENLFVGFITLHDLLKEGFSL